MIDSTRPNPDELLQRTQEEARRQTRGKLKIFFGASAGVGKTFAMLESARQRKREGVDVVAGYVEPHGRKETEALLEGLEVLPFRWQDYKGVRVREFDLDAALQRHPQLILVDELAHTNAEGSRHAKRWQDVQELLEAGIDVYTTVNVQHLESQNDVVAQITGEIQRETIPDAIFEQADDVEVIDLPVDELLHRLQGGKVYRAEQAQLAQGRFFRKGNLTALREIALRRTAERVDAQMQAYQRDRRIRDVWPAAERILVCIGTSPLSQKLVRAAKRMATGLHADWVVTFVQTNASVHLQPEQRENVADALRLAEALGARTVTLSGVDIASEVLDYARRHNISKIVVGKPQKPRWREMLFGSTVDRLVRESGVIDIYVIHGEHDDTEPKPIMGMVPNAWPGRWPGQYWQRPERSRALDYVLSLTVVSISTLLATAMHNLFPTFDLANLIMFYLLGVVVVAIRFGRGPSVVASLVSVAMFDFLFVPPNLTFAINDTRYLTTFGIMLLTALLIGNLTVQVRLQALASRLRECRTQELYDMSREFASLQEVDEIARSAATHISEVFDSHVLVLLADVDKQLRNPNQTQESNMALDERERGVAQWAYEHAEVAGKGTQTLASASNLYLPLSTSQGAIGVLALQPHAATLQPSQWFGTPEQFQQLETFANQTALAIERAQLSDETEDVRVQMETEQLRSSLLSSVSHDLRTPLAAITGAASSLMENGTALKPETTRELAQSIYTEAARLNRLVGNLLEMTRLEAGLQSGRVAAHKELQPIEEVIGSALARLDSALEGREVKTHVPADLPLVPIDAVMIEQVLINLLENALKYTPTHAPISVSAWTAQPGVVAGLDQPTVIVEVADHGPGLNPGDEQRVFEKFYRGSQTDHNGAAPNGTGLGLAIAYGIIAAHGGRIWAENRPGGGASFKFALPI